MDIFIRIIADGTLLPIVVIGIYALVWKIPMNKKYAAYCRVLLAGLTALLVAKFMAALYQPADARPFELYGVNPGAAYLPNPGFPSDHVLFAATITFAVWFETKSRLYSGILLALLITVCIGRVAALVHTPLDVIGGLFAAVVGAAWYFNEKSFTYKK